MFHGEAALLRAALAAISFTQIGTLTRLGQALDELPMIATVNALLFTTLELQTGKVSHAFFFAPLALHLSLPNLTRDGAAR